ncbi:MAG: protein kinase [Casimicrobium sp.]
MQLSPQQLRELGQLADEWLDSDATTRERLQQSARNNGEQFAHAFAVMVAHLEHGVADTTLRPIPSAMRDAALSASMLSSGIADDQHASESAQASTAFGSTATSPERAAGQRIGPYRLIKELGRGGMGVVWLAERADGQHTRQVALKMPLVENLNWLLAARFARERNILASLEHPGIARLYDAGVDNHHHSTQPYIAIEYVQGQPITTYVKEKKLKPEATVQLFTKVIEAVAHAHTQLIIHRDIKPSNILVDAKGEPHLLDFGIAKLLDDEDSNAVDATQLTKLSGRALTLDYASPEQVNNASLGTASDVYSLGVVLYELLTGTRPYHPKGPTRRDLEQAILDQDPQKPSEQLLTQTTGNSESGKSARRMRGDLDTIVLKALRKDPKQRYVTAQAFADDLKRYIGFEPIAARPQGVLYRVSKYARRHRFALTATLVGLAALGALGGYALRQQQQAEASQGRAQAVDSLLRHLFRGMSPDVAATRTFTANELLDRTAQFVDSDNLMDATSRRTANRTMAGLYNEIGEYDKALKRFSDERADALRRGDRERLAGVLVQLVEAQTNAAGIEPAKLDVAEKYCEELRAVIEGGVTGADFLSAQLSFLRGQIERSRNHPTVALTHLADAERRLRSFDSAYAEDLLADTLRARGYVAAAMGELTAARKNFGEALVRYRAANDRKAVAALETSSLLAHVLMRQGQFKQAIDGTRATLKESEERLGANHPITLDMHNTLATASVRVGDFDTARNAARRVREANGPNVAERQRVDEFVSARIAMYSGDTDTAQKGLRALFDARPQNAAGRSFVALSLAEALLRQGRLDEVPAILDTVDSASGNALVSRSGRVLVARILRALLHAKRGEIATARELIAPVTVVLKEDFDDDYYVSLVARAYEALWSEGNLSAQDEAQRVVLASRIERELVWQHGSSNLARWLRARPANHKWSEMPIVL